jgi:hypothetical protein
MSKPGTKYDRVSSASSRHRGVGIQIRGAALHNRAKYEGAKLVALENLGAHVIALVDGRKLGKIFDIRAGEGADYLFPLHLLGRMRMCSR